MIVRNEEKDLSGCLQAIAPVVDEIVVVDTGSQDRTVDTAKAYGARVCYFDWIDDFSAARNESIKCATGDYIIWLDADDRISKENQQKLAYLKKGFPPEKHTAFALQIICRSAAGQSVVYYQLRIFPNVKGVMFEGQIHEEIAPSLNRLGIGIVKENIQIVHTGYKNEKSLFEKAQRNLRILSSKIKGEQQTPKDYCRLAECYFGIRDYKRCLKYIKRARTAGSSANFYKKSYTMMADCYIQTGQADKAVQLLQYALKEYPGNWYMRYLMGATLTFSGKYKEAIPYLTKALDCRKTIEDFPVLSNIDARILYFLGRCLEATGRLQEAAEIYKSSITSEPNDLDALRSYGFLLSKIGRFQEAVEIFKLARKSAPKVDKGIWLALARLQLFENKPDQAIRLYSELLQAYPDDTDALKGIVRACRDTGNLDRLVCALNQLPKGLKISFETMGAVDE
ncbi:MAG: tetratricopeptide repeat protein [Deltaproteobacteria bacterium]|nr:tetratricopeptide repeat protein [Deltaproteobacteria bacterium]MBW2153513.1 tetratricopeptide repeat protein [Deltaproteobacteria bacterium]